MDQVRAAVSVARRVCIIFGALTAIGCQRTGEAAPVQTPPQDTSYRSQPGYVVDSILPLDEALRRFRVGIHSVPTRLEGGASTRSGLVGAFAQALERGDTSSLRSLAVDRAEFAYLNYPRSIYTRPPYEQSPAVVWLQLTLGGDKGLRRAVNRFGGQPIQLLGESCNPTAVREGELRLWRGCVMRFVVGKDTLTRRLFGPIIERDGRFKFASYANQL
jgi:hypothetical protein